MRLGYNPNNHQLLRCALLARLRGFQVQKNRRIVAIVDDDESVRDAIKRLMRSMGLAAEVFASAEEFLGSPDLNRTGCLVADFNMPNMSGLDLHHSLSLQRKEIPTILITAYPSDDVRARALQAGVMGYLTKPFSDHELLSYVRTALDRENGSTS
jgi:FixJ family two-component response regulator